MPDMTLKENSDDVPIEETSSYSAATSPNAVVMMLDSWTAIGPT